MEHIEKNIKLIVILSLSIIFIGYFIFFTSNGYDSNQEDKWQIELVENIADIVHPDQDKIKIIASSLSKWVNYYSENQAYKNAINLLDSLTDSFYSLYYKWYANEIVWNYSKAIEYYWKSMDAKDVWNREKALSLNQIWHVYDTLWDFEKANSYYQLSEKKWENLLWNLINKGRNEFRNWNLEESQKYIKLAIKLAQDKFIKSELYYDLSIISLSWENKLDEAYKYLTHWVNTQKDYPYNYISLWVYNILKWWENLDKSKPYFEKALSINWDLSLAYRYIWVYHYLKWDLKESKKYFEKQLSVLPNDYSITNEDRKILEKDAKKNISILSKQEISKSLQNEEPKEQQIDEKDIVLTSAPEKKQDEEIDTINPKLFVIWLWNQDVWYIELISNSKTTTSKWWVCSSYVVERHPIWWECEIAWNWSSDWKIQCKQEVVDWNTKTQKCWNDFVKTTKTCFSDKDCVILSTSICDRSSCSGDVEKTWDISQLIDISLDLENIESTCDNIYANDEEKCWIKVSTRPIETNQNKNINWFSGTLIKNIKDLSMIGSDRIWLWFDEKTNNALDFSQVKDTTILKTWTGYSFEIKDIKAISPFKSKDWKISFEIQGTDSWTILELKNISYNFLKPYYWDIKIKDWNIKVWAQNTLVLDILKLQNSCNMCSSYIVENFSNSLSTSTPWYAINQIIDQRNLNQTPEIDFNLLYTGSGYAEVNNIITKPYISYKLAWRNVRYQLSENNYPDDNWWIKLNDEKYNWLKIVWTQNIEGKYMIFWKSNSASYQLKTKIRENALLQIDNMKSWDILNWVKYVEWDYEINTNQNYETLIVKNWNVIISKDLTSSLWIIVIKDYYNVNYDYQNKWNVYITPNVLYINAMIYADWWFISVDNSKKPISDSSSRTLVLSKQLVLKWALLTSNTIWWAISSTGEYFLPWMYAISDYNKAMIYDLNYIRRWSSWKNIYNMWFKDPFLIIYDSKIQDNPPKCFE